MKIYISFGQCHVHRQDGVTLDKDTLFCIEAETHNAARAIAFELFGGKFATSYEKPDLTYYPKGIIYHESCN